MGQKESKPFFFFDFSRKTSFKFKVPYSCYFDMKIVEIVGCGVVWLTAGNIYYYKHVHWETETVLKVVFKEIIWIFKNKHTLNRHSTHSQIKQCKLKTFLRLRLSLKIIQICDSGVAK